MGGALKARMLGCLFIQKYSQDNSAVAYWTPSCRSTKTCYAVPTLLCLCVRQAYRTESLQSKRHSATATMHRDTIKWTPVSHFGTFEMQLLNGFSWNLILEVVCLWPFNTFPLRLKSKNKRKFIWNPIRRFCAPQEGNSLNSQGDKTSYEQTLWFLKKHAYYTKYMFHASLTKWATASQLLGLHYAQISSIFFSWTHTHTHRPNIHLIFTPFSLWPKGRRRRRRRRRRHRHHHHDHHHHQLQFLFVSLGPPTA